MTDPTPTPADRIRPRAGDIVSLRLARPDGSALPGDYLVKRVRFTARPAPELPADRPFRAGDVVRTKPGFRYMLPPFIFMVAAVNTVGTRTWVAPATTDDGTPYSEYQSTDLELVTPAPEPPADRSEMVHLLADTLLPACHVDGEEGGYRATPKRDRVTCPRCLDLATAPTPPADELRDLMPDIGEREMAIDSDPIAQAQAVSTYGREARLFVDSSDPVRVSVRLAAVVGALVSDAVEQERERVRTELDAFLRGLDAGDR